MGMVWGANLAAIAVSLSDFEQCIRILSLLLAIFYTSSQIYQLFRKP